MSEDDRFVPHVSAEPVPDSEPLPSHAHAAVEPGLEAQPIAEAELESQTLVAAQPDSVPDSELVQSVVTDGAPADEATPVSDVEVKPESPSVAAPEPEPQSEPQPSAASPVAESVAEAPKGAPRTIGFDPSVEERKRKAQAHWQNVASSRESGEIFTGTVTSAVKGGLLVDIGGIRGFLPASQVRPEAGAALESLVKSKVPLRVIDVDENRRRVVVSQRRALDQQRRQQRNELLRSLKIGARFEGKVVRLAPFGAFVDIGGIEGLIPMSELAFERVAKVEDVLTVGDALDVTILRIEDGGKKIGLSRKNALPDAIRDHATLLRPGNVIEGTVVAKDTRLEIEIAPGVIGTVRESDANPADYAVGEKVEVAVRYVDRKTRRVVLTTLHGAAAALPRSSGFAPLGQELGRN